MNKRIIIGVAVIIVASFLVGFVANDMVTTDLQWKIQKYVYDPGFEITVNEYEITDLYIESHPIKVVQRDNEYDIHKTTYGTYLVASLDGYIVPQFTTKLPFNIPLSSMLSFSEEAFGEELYGKLQEFRTDTLNRNVTQFDLLKNLRVVMDETATVDYLKEYSAIDLNENDIFGLKGHEVLFELVLTPESYYKFLTEPLVVDH